MRGESAPRSSGGVVGVVAALGTLFACAERSPEEAEPRQEFLTAVVQVNSGGWAEGSFTADQFYSGGLTYSTSSAISTAGVMDAAPAAVYRSERYGNFSYTVTGLSAGAAYTVRLHFAEIYWTSAGMRVFRVAINGTTVLNNFDVFAAAGSNNKAVVRAFTANASGSGQIVIQYTGIQDQAKSSGLEILTGTAPPPDAAADTAPPADMAPANTPPTVATAASANPNPVSGTSTSLSVLGADNGGEANLTYTWAATGSPPAPVTFSANGTNAAKNSTATFSASGSYTLQATIRDQPGLTTTSSVTVSVTIPSGGTKVYQINSGGSAVSPFAADQFVSGGNTYSTGSAVSTSGVANAAPAAVYQSERWGNFTYTFGSLTPGAAYTVRLHFAEIYWNASGVRRFNVSINGSQVLSNYDIYAVAGGFKAVVRDFPVNASGGGQIAIQYTGVSDQAKSSGIEIITAGGAPGNQPPTVATPASASPNPVTGTTTSLNSLGADDGGQANLIYTWAATGTPPGPVSFSPNGTNAAKASTATFTRAGSYALRVTMQDQGGLTVTSTVNVTVNQTLTTLTVSPASATVTTNSTQQFTASATDQFGQSTTNPTLSWTVSGGGTINASGLFTAGGTAGGPYTVTGSGGGKNGTASVTVSSTGGGNLLLRADPTKRFLVNGSGQPFLVWGESAWNLGVQEKVSDQDLYLADRAGRGINAIEVMAISRYQDGDPRDADGVAPFTTPGDLATFNSAYFNKLSNLIGRAAARGMVVFLAPAWAGYDGNQGFHDMLVANGTTKCQNYGAAIASVLQAHDNIVWIIGGDKPGSFPTSVYSAMANGIRSVDTRHMITAHWNFAPTDSRPGPWEEIAGTYLWDGGIIYTQVQSEYQEGDAPVVALESLYELNQDWGYTPKILRFQTLMTMLSGGKGYFFGHEGVWHFGSSSANLAPWSRGAPFNLNSEGMAHYQRAGSFFSSRAWKDLVPDLSSTLVTAGRGSYGGTSYVGAAKTPNGRLGLAYLPNGGTITVNLAQMTLPLTARWFDPTNGNFTAAGTFTTPASRTFTTPGNNGSGATDWMLVLETQ